MKFSDFWKEVRELLQINSISIEELFDIDVKKEKCKHLWNKGYTVEETVDIVFLDDNY